MIRLYAFEGGSELVDKSIMTLHRGMGHRIEIPYQFFLVEHPKGRLMFDTGANPDAALHPDAYPPSALWGVRVREEDLAPARLAQVGLQPEQVDLVANSHLHYDHAGGNVFFQHASILVQTEELRGAFWPEPWERGNFNRPDFDLPLRWEDLDSDHDVFGDDSCVLIQTPGHTRGSQSLVLKLPDTGSVILAQDAVYLDENIDDFVMPASFWDMAQVARSMRRLRDLRRVREALLVPGHDIAAWRRLRHAPEAYT